LQRGPLSPDEALALGMRVSRSLAVLHDHGVVHRDIKPENLFLRGGRPDDVCLLDLGIARLLAPDRRTTRHGMVVGTPAYMAPEQARAAPELDHRADLYALGTVLYECLSGQQAWPGQNALAVMVKILVQPPPRLAQTCPGLPPALDGLVSGLMATDPGRRPTDARAAATAIEGVRALLPVLVRGDIDLRSVRRRVGRRDRHTRTARAGGAAHPDVPARRYGPGGGADSGRGSGRRHGGRR
jgi:serine/threonine protein kinase